MKVLVTGGTGLIGSHTTAALLAAGHEVRLLVRDRSRLGPALEPLGVGEVDVADGDMTDAAAVRTALEGCEAVIHAASVYSFDRRRDAEIRQSNVRGAETVLKLAVEAGLDPVVHVSSSGALLRKQPVALSPESPPGDAPGAYWQSKAESEVLARQLQEQGAPVVIVYPSSTMGPNDPYLGESNRVIALALKGMFRFAPRMRVVVSDARDVARLLAAVVEPGRGPRRYAGVGTLLEAQEAMRRLSEVTGRPLKMTHIPAAPVRLIARVTDALQPFVPFRFPLSTQLFLFGLNTAGWDDSRTREELGIEPRPVEETLTDTIRSLVEMGHLRPRHAGRALSEPVPA